MDVFLPDVCTIQYGFPFDSAKFSSSEGTPLIRIRDVVRGYSKTYTSEKYSEEYIVNDGDLLIGMDGEFNIAKWKGGKALLNQRVCRLFPKSDIDKQYLFYYMSQALKQIEDKTPFATVKHLSAKQLNSIIVPMLPLDEQHRIGAVLDKISDLIALRKQQLAKLDELVKARFMEIFGDIIHNNLNWPTFSLSDIANSRLGKMLNAKQQTGQYSFPYLANFNVQWFRFEIDELHKMDFNEADQKEFELRDGDLLVCEGGEVGRCAVWHNQVIPCYFQKALHRIRCNLEIIEPDYLSWWFKFHCDYNQFEDIVGSKATIAHLPGAKLKKLEIVVPPIGLQRQFSYFIAEVEKTRLTIRQGLDKLETMKRALMQEYFG